MPVQHAYCQAKNINKSLSALGNVIKALADPRNKDVSEYDRCPISLFFTLETTAHVCASGTCKSIAQARRMNAQLNYLLAATCAACPVPRQQTHLFTTRVLGRQFAHVQYFHQYVYTQPLLGHSPVTV